MRIENMNLPIHLHHKIWKKLVDYLIIYLIVLNYNNLNKLIYIQIETQCYTEFSKSSVYILYIMAGIKNAIKIIIVNKDNKCYNEKLMVTFVSG